MVQVGLDITLLMQIVQFLIIVLIVKTLIADPVHKTMAARDERIASLTMKSKKSLEAIQAKKLEYEEKLRAVKSEIALYNNELKTEANMLTAKMLEEVKQQTQSEIEKALIEIKKETETARNTLKGEISELSAQVVQVVTK